MKLTKCPYCGKKIGYFTAFRIRRQGEFFCNRCKKDSNVHIRKTILMPLFAVLILAIVIVLFFLFITDRGNLWYMLLAALPFFFFYLITPFFVQLRPKKKHMDVLYDTEMIEAAQNAPDIETAGASKSVPAFSDDLDFDDDGYRPNINAAVFNAIKEERNIVSDTDGGTKPFDRFEDISSTRPVKNIKDISSRNLDNFDVDGESYF